jgi:hypothetical protein
MGFGVGMMRPAGVAGLPQGNRGPKKPPGCFIIHQNLRAVGTLFAPSWACFAPKMQATAYQRAENQGFFVEIGVKGDFNNLGDQNSRRTGRNS